MTVVSDLGKDLRTQFPILKPNACYLDNAATTHKPQSVVDAMSHFMTHEYATVNRAVYRDALKSTQKFHDVRTKVQHFIGARYSEEIIFTRGTTDGINLLASSLGQLLLNAGDIILITELEHHSNIVPWQMVAKQYGATLKAVPILPSGEMNLDAFYEILDSGKVKIFSAAHVSNVLGLKRDIKKIMGMARDKGAITVVDGAQAPSHMSIDVADIGAHFYLFSSHKMYGPTGLGVLWGELEWLKKIPPYQGGGDMISEVTIEKTTYQEPPLKFEAGTPSIVEVIGLGAAIDFLQAVGIDAIEKYEKDLFLYLLNEMKEIKWVKIIGDPDERVSILPFIVEGVHSLDLGTFLGMKGVSIRTGHMCAQPALRALGYEHICRASVGLYNTKKDIDMFIKVLKETVLFLS
ncbi:MAG: cysteine desulfurase [Rhabdochlamydiaceae bacterium]|nr:cysteine desulfurase [Candidatus Amphrikana amoebophyrae]